MEPQDTPAEPARKRGGQPGITRGPYKDAARKQLKDAIKQLDAAIATPMRAEKVADLIIHKTELLTRLIDEEREDKQNAALQELETLTVQHEQDAVRIAELTSNLALAERRASERLTVTVPDNRVPQLQAELQESKQHTHKIIQMVTSELDEDSRCRLAVRIVLLYGHTAAKDLCSLLGFSSVDIACALNERPEALTDSVELSRKSTEYTRLCAAIIRVRTGESVQQGCRTGTDNPYSVDRGDFAFDWTEQTSKGSLIK